MVRFTALNLLLSHHDPHFPKLRHVLTHTHARTHTHTLFTSQRILREELEQTYTHTQTRVSGVIFINGLRAAFTCADPECTTETVDFTVFLRFWDRCA